jgi:hypothetical protein
MVIAANVIAAVSVTGLLSAEMLSRPRSKPQAASPETSRPAPEESAEPVVPEPPPTPAPAAAQSAVVVSAQLVLVNARGIESADGAYCHVEGDIRNASARAFDGVLASVRWFDKNGRQVGADDALVEADPLRPGETSRFRASTGCSPAIATYALSFRLLDGSPLSAEDPRGRLTGRRW